MRAVCGGARSTLTPFYTESIIPLQAPSRPRRGGYNERRRHRCCCCKRTNFKFAKKAALLLDSSYSSYFSLCNSNRDTLCIGQLQRGMRNQPRALTHKRTPYKRHTNGATVQMQFRVGRVYRCCCIQDAGNKKDERKKKSSSYSCVVYYCCNIPGL